MSLHFLDRLLPNVNAVPSRFLFPLGLTCLQFERMAARKKGNLVLYSGNLVVSGEQLWYRICHKMEILSFPCNQRGAPA